MNTPEPEKHGAHVNTSRTEPEISKLPEMPADRCGAFCRKCCKAEKGCGTCRKTIIDDYPDAVIGVGSMM